MSLVESHDLIERTCGRLLEEAARIMAGAVRPGVADGAAAAPDGRFDVVARGVATRRPVVSVIIPTFERPRLLQATVDSVLAQHDVDAEIIVVDDAGATGPVSLGSDRVGRNQAVTIVRHRENFGLGAARNTGASIAAADWLLMLDDDDVLLPGGLNHLLSAAAERDDARFVFGDHVRQWYTHSGPSNREHVATLGERWSDLPIENPIICGSFIVAKDTFRAIGGYREDCPVHEDYNLHIRLLRAVTTRYVRAAVNVYHCRRAIARLNDRRVYWFATSALNYALFRSLFARENDADLQRRQAENQYEHLARSAREGWSQVLLQALVGRWRQTLEAHGLTEALRIDAAAAGTVLPTTPRA